MGAHGGNGVFERAPISAGGWYCLALRGDGTVWAWAWNWDGQLGDGTTSHRLEPVGVLGLTRVLAISGGSRHSLALKDDGTVWAWGDNGYGQLGDGTTTPRRMPIEVVGLSDVIAVSAGHYHSLALKDDGTVWAWGGNGCGQLGDGTITHCHEPQQVPGLSGMMAVSGGYAHSLAVKDDGTVWAWGYNGYHQLGDGTTTDQHQPQQVPGLNSVVSVSAGGWHALAVKDDGTVWAWGRNEYGQLGDGSTSNRSEAVQVSGLKAIAISGGYDHSLAVSDDRTAWAWGYNGFDQLGDGTTTDRHQPIQISGLTGVVAVSAGGSHSLAAKDDGEVWAWGWNGYGQLGDGSTALRTRPIQSLINLNGTVPANYEDARDPDAALDTDDDLSENDREPDASPDSWEPGSDDNAGYRDDLLGVADEALVEPEESASTVLTSVANPHNDDEHTLIVLSPVGSGSVDPPVGTYTHEHAAGVTLTATAGDGWEFDQWAGAVDDTASPSTTITVDEEKTVKAVFRRQSELPAGIPPDTVVLGSRAYDIAYANAPENLAEIRDALMDAPEVYIKNSKGVWINNATSRELGQKEKAALPPVTYRDASGQESAFGPGDGPSIAIYAVTFRITDGHGIPIQGARVAVNGDEAITGEDGEARLRLLGLSYAMTVRKDGYETFSGQVAVDGQDVCIELGYLVTAVLTNAFFGGGITVTSNYPDAVKYRSFDPVTNEPIAAMQDLGLTTTMLLAGEPINEALIRLYDATGSEVHHKIAKLQGHLDGDRNPHQ